MRNHNVRATGTEAPGTVPATTDQHGGVCPGHVTAFPGHCPSLPTGLVVQAQSPRHTRGDEGTGVTQPQACRDNSLVPSPSCSEPASISSSCLPGPWQQPDHLSFLSGHLWEEVGRGGVSPFPHCPAGPFLLWDPPLGLRQAMSKTLMTRVWPGRGGCEAPARTLIWP